MRQNYDAPLTGTPYSFRLVFERDVLHLSVSCAGINTVLHVAGDYILFVITMTKLET